MEHKILTNALFWEKQGEMPSFRKMKMECEESELIIKVQVAMFGKTLYRALMIGHPHIVPPKVLGTLLVGVALNTSGKIKSGSRVVINPHAVDENNEKLCIVPGAIAERVIIRNRASDGVFIIPDSVSFEEAIYTELISCAIEALERASKADELVIVGCGTMALIQIQLAVRKGFSKILCIYNHPTRKKIVEENGAIAIEYDENFGFLKQEVDEILEGKRVAIIDSVGSNISINLIFEMARENTDIILFAGYPEASTYSIDLNKIHYGNISILGSYHFENEMFEMALKMLEEKVIDVKQLITGRISWKNIDQIYKNFSNESNISNIVIFD